jgi:hypothetical protein
MQRVGMTINCICRIVDGHDPDAGLAEESTSKTSMQLIGRTLMQRMGRTPMQRMGGTSRQLMNRSPMLGMADAAEREVPAGEVAYEVEDGRAILRVLDSPRKTYRRGWEEDPCDGRVVLRALDPSRMTCRRVITEEDNENGGAILRALD